MGQSVQSWDTLGSLADQALSKSEPHRRKPHNQSTRMG